LFLQGLFNCNSIESTPTERLNPINPKLIVCVCPSLFLLVGRVHGFKTVAKNSQNIGNNSVMLKEGGALNLKYHSFKKFTKPWKQ
jgi:hypothetical protein